MFGKLKDKLKGAMSIFSKKAEEEADIVDEKKIIEEKKVSKKQVKVTKSVKNKKPVEKKDEEKDIVDEKTVLEEVYEEEKNEEVKEKKEKKKDKVKDVVEDEVEKEDVVEDEVEKEDVVEVGNNEVKEEKSFFGKLKSVFVKEDDESNLDIDVDERIEQVNEEIKEKEVKEVKEVKEEKEVKEVKGEKVIQESNDEKPGFFGKIKQSFTTKTISADKFEELFWDMEMALLENNVSVEVIEKMKVDLKEELVEKPLPRDVPKKIEETLKNTLDEILTHKKINLVKDVKNKRTPFIIAFFGINGAGKTTSIAKLANYLKENKLSVVLAACDTFRAAAIQQLQEHADKLDVPMIKHDYGSDAAAVAYDAIKYADKNKIDVVLIDTAGRLHSNTNLMAELEKIIRITKPDMKIFVGESITGNDCIEQAKKFNELVEMDGAILTKADVDEKGGAPLSISYTIGKPILFLGIGQEYKDFEEFDKSKILERLGF